MTGSEENGGESRWRRLSELRDDAFQVWKKPSGVLNPSSVIATVDENNTPHTAPFGSLHAVTPRLLRVVIHRYHDTLANLKRNKRVMICLVSVKGQARVVAEPWKFDERYAIVEIDIEEVKNDLPMKIGIDSGISISAEGDFQSWWKGCWIALHKD